MSASAPLGRPSRKTGSVEADCTRATSTGEVVSEVMSQAAATSFIHMQVLAAIQISQSMRKVGPDSGAQTPCWAWAVFWPSASAAALSAAVMPDGSSIRVPGAPMPEGSAGGGVEGSDSEAGGWAGTGVVCSAAMCPDRKSTRLNSSHANISYAVFCLKKKKGTNMT